jgi:hypothetical protein
MAIKITGVSKRDLTMIVPEGQLVDREWLQERGFNRHDIDYYLRAGHLLGVTRGVYRRPGATLKWQHIVYSLQSMGYVVHVGGKTALSESGLSHYLELGMRDIQLFSASPLPSWLTNWHLLYLSDFRFETYRLSWLKDLAPSLCNQQLFGGWDWKIEVAQAELGILEWLSLAKTEAELQAIDAVFDGLSTLSPKRIQIALALCDSVQIKRLFAWYASRHQHAWLKQVDFSRIEMGSGKRSFIKGGVLNKQWQITVPKSLERPNSGDGFESEQSLF